MRPELGLRDEVADLIVLAWAALRQRAWYQHGSSIPAPRPGATRPDMELRPEPLPVPADWEAATSRAEVLFGIRVNPYLTAAGLAEFTESRAGARWTSWPTPPRPSCRGWSWPTGTSACPPTSPGRLATARAGAALVEALRRAGGRVRLVETLARTALPATDTAVANSLSRAQAVASAVDAFRWERLAPLRAAENQADDRGRAAARALTSAAGGGRGGRVRDQARPGPVGRRRRHLRLALRGSARRASAEPQPRPPGRRAHLRAAVAATPAGRSGRATRAKGAPASEVLGPLRAFLDAHRDEQVVVEWRVQE